MSTWLDMYFFKDKTDGLYYVAKIDGADYIHVERHGYKTKKEAKKYIQMNGFKAREINI